MEKALTLLEELLSITEPLKHNMDSATLKEWQKISAETADLREENDEQ